MNVKESIDKLLDKHKDWLEHYEEMKGDRWFRKKWITDKIRSVYKLLYAKDVNKL